MSKAAEIDYPLQIARVLGVTPEAVETGLLDKPYGDDSRHSYLLDVAQILALLPRPPARLLDLGVGTGWTSRIFARCGYEVVALDISPHMIELARRAAGAHSRGKGQVRFFAHDYEAGLDFGSFDAAVIYDALHHAEDEAAVIANVHAALAPGGVFVTIEPGVGHSTTPNSIETMEKFGTTEKDMDFARQRQIMRAAGFTRVEQYVRLSQLVLGDVTRDRGYAQRDLLEGLLENTLHQGITSVVVARKPLPGETATDDEVVEHHPPRPSDRPTPSASFTPCIPSATPWPSTRATWRNSTAR
jgi:SAM-dependent methyltransferase